MIDSTVLIGTAASIGFLHTIVGVDHTLPFVVMGRARGWSLRKTLGLTALCGLGHVLGSVLLGAIGIGLGVAVGQLELIEGARGSLASWGLIAFGLTYAAWSAVRTHRNKRHAHSHAHDDGTVHSHAHHHHEEHTHAHADAEGGTGMTGWALFVLFIFGPCEALIPLLMAPAWTHDWWVVAAVVLVFGAVTIGVMLGTVAVAFWGLGFARMAFVERHAGLIAGLAIAMSGLAIEVFGI